MDIASSFITLLGVYLEGSNLREKNKYKDKYLKLRKQYVYEISKSEENIDTNNVDGILNDLCDLSKVVTSAKA